MDVPPPPPFVFLLMRLHNRKATLLPVSVSLQEYNRPVLSIPGFRRSEQGHGMTVT